MNKILWLLAVLVFIVGIIPVLFGFLGFVLDVLFFPLIFFAPLEHIIIIKTIKFLLFILIVYSFINYMIS